MKLVRCQRDGQAQFAWLESDALYRCASDPLLDQTLGPALGRVSDHRLLSPCIPGKVIGLAVNYAGATGQTTDQLEPLVFLKTVSSVSGPGDDIVSPFPGLPVWGEAELAIVVGKQLRGASEAEAQAAIFGYTAGNDVTAENTEGRDHHLARSKAADGFCPLGPWIDTAYQPAGRLVEGYQNGELIRRGNTDQRLWTDSRCLAWLSAWMTLDPWDVVLTGTPARVVPRRYLQAGDEYVVRIEGLGELRNRFRERVV